MVNRGHRTLGYTIAEILIGALLLVLVLGTLLFVYTGSMRSYFKGEDALSSVQDASVLMMHLRRDLQRFEPSTSSPCDVLFVPAGAGGGTGVKLKVDPSLGTLSGGPAGPADAGVTMPTSGSVLAFSMRMGDQVELVTYVYRADASAIERRSSASPDAKWFAMPRLRSFEVGFHAQPSADPAPLDLFSASGGPPPVRVQELWFDVRMRLQSDETEGPDIGRTAVELATHVFPKRANRALGSVWYEPPTTAP
jgi:hypothetical protein